VHLVGFIIIMEAAAHQNLLTGRHVSLPYQIKVKQSHYRPGVAQRVAGSYRFPHFLTVAQDGGKVVSLTHRPPLPPGNTPGTHFC
jgi:hypothetical protein